jgi:hypothetical protein
MSEPLKWRQKAVLAKIESTYGQDAGPTGAANAILALNGELTPMQGDVVARDLLQPYLGATEDIPVGVHVACAFDVELAGAGAAGTAPAYGPLLRACGFAETINAGTDVQYDPVTTGQEALSLYFHMASNLHKLLGSRANTVIRIAPKQIPAMRFSFLGLWVDPAAAALPAADFSAFQDPLPASNANTPTFTLHGFEGVVRDFSLDLGNQVVHEDLINSESVDLNDRQVKGTLTLNATAIADKDFFAIAKARTKGTLQVIHGLGAGKIVQLDAPKVQLLNPRYGNADGTTTMTLDLKLLPDTGDDELKITVK